MRNQGVPEGLKNKALALSLGIEMRTVPETFNRPPLYRFSNRGQAVTRWLSLADAHQYLDSCEESERRQA